MVSNNTSAFFFFSGKCGLTVGSVLTFLDGLFENVPHVLPELKKHQPWGRSLWSRCWSSWVQDAGVCWVSRAGAAGPSGKVRQPPSPLAKEGCEWDCPYLARTRDSLCQLQWDVEETHTNLQLLTYTNVLLMQTIL